MIFKDILKLAGSIIICQLAGFIGSLFTTPAIRTWYKTLTKPAFTPPNFIFSPVWITLFLLMGISLFLVWQKKHKDREVKIALLFFTAQLILNTFWSILFFGLKSPLWAFIEIVILWLAILVTIIKFFKVSKPAGYLLLPYILWVSFAAFLNFSLWRLNA
ncbi:MAG: tryptophan-rich sensory protein [Candidatus Aminicenantes bacterium]|nr:tryptophan-rich sensory protein [Candidatus Aminicenantes bacterium]